jgi:hypothetical protein
VTARARFFTLSTVLLGVLALGEALGRRDGAVLAAVAQRVTFKLALLEARGSADFVVLGSSRGNDCVTPAPLAAALGPSWRGASLATPSSSLPTLEYVAKRAALTPGLKLAFVELSRRQLAPGQLELEVAPPQDPLDPVGNFLFEHSALLKGRRAFAVENWSRLPALLVPSRYDGGEFFHSRWLAETFVWPGPVAPGELDRLVPAHDAPLAEAGPEWERVVDGYRRVVEPFRAHGVKVVLFGSPLAAVRRPQECDAAGRGFRAAVAAAVDAPLFDFACSEVDETYLTDKDEHCGTLGRERFSARLGLSARADALP